MYRYNFEHEKMLFLLAATVSHDLDCQRMGDLGREIYTTVNTNKNFRMAMQSNFELFHVHSEMWEKDKNKEKNRIEIKKISQHNLDVALNDLVQKGGVIDCRIMRDLAMLWSALNYSEKMGEKFSEPVVISGESDMYDDVSILSFDLAPIGSYVYVPNIKDYNEVHDFGGAQGENLCVVGRNNKGENLFVSFLNAKPRTISAIYHELYKAFMQKIDRDKLKYSLTVAYIQMYKEQFIHLLSDEREFDFKSFYKQAEEIIPAGLNEFIETVITERQEIQAKYRNEPELFFEELINAQQQIFDRKKVYLYASVLKKEFRDLETAKN